MSSSSGKPGSKTLPISVTPTVPKPRVSLSMLKGKSGSVSVPSFAFRFNSLNDNSLEELGELGESESLEVREVGEEIETTTTGSRRATPTPPPTPPGNDGLFGASKSKRAQSLDAGSADPSLLESWSLLNKIKGGLARKVEEAKKYRLELQSGNLLKREATVSKTLEKVSSAEVVVEDVGLEAFPEVQEVAEDTPAAAAEKSEAVESVEAESEAQTSVELRLRKSATSGGAEEPRVTFSRSSKPEFAGGADDQADKKVVVVSEPLLHCQDVSTVPQPLQLQSEQQQQRDSSPSRTIYAYCTAIALVIFILPLPSFLHGLLAGIAVGVGSVYFCFGMFGYPSGRASKRRPMRLESVVLHLQHAKDEKPGVKKAWMNELLMDYSLEEFHLSQTHSVYVRLDGANLRISYQKGKVPKRAMWNEPMPIPNYDPQRMYNLEGARVTIIPEGLAKKRLWSRRYPILIVTKEGTGLRESPLPSHLKKKNAENHVVLFPRTGREKEEWFWLLQKVAGGSVTAEALKLSLDYSVYMSRLIPSPSSSPTRTSTSSDQKPASNGGGPALPATVLDMAWLNAFLGRIFWDFKHSKEWVTIVSAKIQRKLNAIRVPYFIKALHLSELDLGNRLPEVEFVGQPVLNDRGLWIEAKIVYYGNFRMTLETKLDLMKLKRDPPDSGIELGQEPTSPSLSEVSSIALSAYDSDAEESAESSDDEASGEPSEGVVGEEIVIGRGSTGQKILRIVDTITQSRYFQQASEYRFLKKAMEGVSNTPLMLTVELVSLGGTLVLNVPPPPSDRLWYGFRGNPELSLAVKPKVGEWNVQFTYVLDWIEKKLILEFQRILVLPNMDDLVLPIMNPKLGPSGGDREGSCPATPPS